MGKDFTEADKGKKFMNPRARKTGGKVVKMAKGGMRTKANWNTWEPADEEETKASGFTPSDSFDEDEESEGVKSSNQARMREARARRRGADTQHTVPNLLAGAMGSQTDAEEEAPKKQSFGEAFRAAKGSDFTWNGKKYSGKTKEQSSKPKDKEQATPVPAAKRNEPSVLPKASTNDSTVDARENNRLRQANPTMWDALKKVEADKPRRSPDSTANTYSSKVSTLGNAGWKKGGTIKKAKAKAYAAGGSVRGGGCESKGKTKGRMR